MLNIEEVKVEFIIEIQEVSFNNPGRYFLEFSIQSSEPEGALQDVTFKVDDGEKEKGSKVTTGVFEVQKDQVQMIVQYKKIITFYIPKGMCKESSPLLLQVDVFQKLDRDVKEGTTQVVIFPASNGSLEPGPDRILYSINKTILNVTRRLEEESISVHVGRIICNYSLQALTPEPTPQPTPDPTLEPSEEPTKGPTAEPEPKVLKTPEVPSVKAQPPLSLKTVEEPNQIQQKPAKQLPKTKGSERYREHIVSEVGKEEVIVQVHAASGLPKLAQDEKLPFPYVAGTTKRDEEQGCSAQHTTSISTKATCYPSWEETIVVVVEDEQQDSTEALVLMINDLSSKTTLLRYTLPIRYFQPFHQYHVVLIQEINGFEAHLYISILRRTSRLRLLDSFMFNGIEITLQSFHRNISNVSGELLAMVQIVPDYYTFRKDCQLSRHTSELHPHQVKCPVQEMDFYIANTKHSHPQISLPLPQANPSGWKQQLLFCEDRQMASMFTSTSALLIQYYSTQTAFNGSTWYLGQCLGYSTMLLTEHVFNALISERGRQGIQVNNLSLKETDLMTDNGHIPAVNLILRLISEERPDSLLNASYLDDLPRLESFSLELSRSSPSLTQSPIHTRVPTPKERTPPRKPSLRDGNTPPPIPLHRYTAVQSGSPKASYKFALQEGELPPLDAVQSLLPDPERIILDPDRRYQDHPGLIPTRLPPKDLVNPSHELNNRHRQDIPADKYVVTLLDHQQRELDNYKSAMKRMGDEIVKLQEEVTRLEFTNKNIRQEANRHKQTTKALLRDSELMDVPRNELIQGYVSLRDKFSSQVQEATSYRDKLLQLQNELIRHKEKETEFVDLQHAHSKQSAILQRLQEKQHKIKKLEETCRKQEEVIEKMEKLFKGKFKKEKNEGSSKVEIKEALLLANSRLRSEINEMKSKLQPKNVSFDDTERMELYSKLDRSDGRVRTLERAVQENARKWGQEKEEMILRINEHTQRAALPPLNRSYYQYDDDEEENARIFPTYRARPRLRGGRYGSPHLEPLI